MTTKEVKNLKAVCSKFVMHTLHYGQEVLRPSGSEMVKRFEHSKCAITKERILQFSARYNGDEVVFLLKAYWTPNGVYWWPTEVYNMATNKPMRNDAARSLLYDLSKRGKIKSYDTSSVKLIVNGDVRTLVCGGLDFDVRPSGNYLWISKVGDPYWEMVKTIKEAKIKVHEYVTSLEESISNINQ